LTEPHATLTELEWELIPSSAHSAHMHMALDEVLLDRVIARARKPAVRSFREIGVPASYREINDIISPRGKIAGAAQARRRGFVLHHTTIAHAMDVDLLPRLIRIGRLNVSQRGVRSAEKSVSPLSWFTDLSCDEVARTMTEDFAREFGAQETHLTALELDQARYLVTAKYATAAWINRLP